jgi:hypothetical protein
MVYAIYFIIGFLYMLTLEWAGTKSLKEPVQFTTPERILISLAWPVFVINTIARVFSSKK